jgi:hypothetical protein
MVVFAGVATAMGAPAPVAVVIRFVGPFALGGPLRLAQGKSVDDFK